VYLRIATLLLVTAVGCNKSGSSTTQSWPDKPGPKALATFAPITCFVANVAGDRGTVRGIMSTQGPHEFVDTRSDAANVAGADLFFINGLELDNRIADKMKAASGNRALAIVDLGSKFDELRLLEGECHHEHADGHKHEHGLDPHIWLGPDMAISLVEFIRDEYKRADAAHAADYDRRAGEYIAKLKQLHADGKKLLASKKLKILTMHESMGYFARAFELEVVGSIQTTPGQEPTRKKLDELVKTCVEKQVNVLAVEPQYTTSNSVQVIQRELKAKGLTGIQVVELDPLETSPDAVPPLDFYERKMRENLNALAATMK
jgi:zinc transport system substrate-binding protein